MKPSFWRASLFIAWATACTPVSDHAPAGVRELAETPSSSSVASPPASSSADTTSLSAATASAAPLSSGRAPAPASSGPDLTFLGTVTRIEIADTGDPRKEWVVTTKVDKVLSGSFTGSQFSFAIHSPSKSGLAVGKQYSIQAT